MNKFIELMKEVFWLKKSTARKRPSRRTPVKKKKLALKKPVPAKKPAIRVAKPVKAPKPAKSQKPLKPPTPLKVPKVKGPVLDPNLVQAGEITHYFERIKVCVVKITHGSVLIGDRLTVKGPKTFFVQKVWSMQIESKDVKVAKKGELIGVKVDKPVVVGDIVYK